MIYYNIKTVVTKVRKKYVLFIYSITKLRVYELTNKIKTSTFKINFMVLLVQKTYHVQFY